MKKVILASALGVLAATGAEANVKHQFYVGAGLADLVGHHESNIDQFDGAVHHIDTPGFSKNAFGFDLMIGYSALINNFLLRLEFDYMFGNINRRVLLNNVPTNGQFAKV